jgi:hypothetical protein
MAMVGVWSIRDEKGGIALSGIEVSSAPQSSIGVRGEDLFREIKIELAI